MYVLIEKEGPYPILPDTTSNQLVVPGRDPLKSAG